METADPMVQVKWKMGSEGCWCPQCSGEASSFRGGCGVTPAADQVSSAAPEGTLALVSMGCRVLFYLIMG